MKENLDIVLYNKYLEGEKEAFELLYNKYKNKITYFIFNIIKDYQKAEDITQDVFIYVLQNQKKTNCSFKYYLYLVAKSKALTYTNIEKRRNEINELYINNTEDIEKDVIDVIIKEENQREILEAINQLDDKYKNAIYLVNIEGLSYKETAEILDESVQNIKSLIHRSKKELKEILKKKGYDVEVKKLSKTILSILLVIVLATGTVWAAVKLYNYFEYRSLNLEQFESKNGFLYKKIYTYNEYEEYKSQVNNLLAVSENEFKDNFVIIIVSERTKLNGLTYKEYTVEDDSLDIKLVENNEPNEAVKTSGVAIVIPKDCDRNTINIEKVSEEMNISRYTNIKELPSDYSKQQAITDNCLIIDQNEKKTYNREILLSFLNEVEQKQDSEIRIYQIEKEKIFIQDIKYIPNTKFIITYDYTRYRTELSYETDEIYTTNINKKNMDSFDEKIELYSIEDNNNQFTFGVYVE